MRKLFLVLTIILLIAGCNSSDNTNNAAGNNTAPDTGACKFIYPNTMMTTWPFFRLTRHWRVITAIMICCRLILLILIATQPKNYMKHILLSFRHLIHRS